MNYEEKVGTYWPEFATHGKEDITVAMLLSHQAGICSPETRNVEDYYDQSIMAEKLAGMTPIWEPGYCLWLSFDDFWLAGSLRINSKSNR